MKQARRQSSQIKIILFSSIKSLVYSLDFRLLDARMTKFGIIAQIKVFDTFVELVLVCLYLPNLSF